MTTTILNGKQVDYYGEEMTERRRRFNNIIDKIDMVLMNNIPEVDTSIWENWQDKSPLTGASDECEIEDRSLDSGKSGDFHCIVHGIPADTAYQCEEWTDEDTDAEVYQWFAISDHDADYLQRHNQYVTYSDMLDTYFLAICHYGTGWDYVDSMVNDILGDS
jgi:hypothetical protein